MQAREACLRVMAFMGYEISNVDGELHNFSQNRLSLFFAFSYAFLSIYYLGPVWIGTTLVNILLMCQIVLNNYKAHLNFCASVTAKSVPHSGVPDYYHSLRNPWLSASVLYVIIIFCSIIPSSVFLLSTNDVESCFTIIGFISVFINFFDTIHNIVADLFSDCTK